MSFVAGFSASTSSHTPTRNMVAAVAISTGIRSGNPNAAAHPKATTAMPTPPNSATGRRCQRSGVGRAKKPQRAARLRQSGTMASDSANASRNGAEMALIMPDKSYRSDRPDRPDMSYAGDGVAHEAQRSDDMKSAP